MFQGCSGVVPGCSGNVPGCSGGVPGCSGNVPGCSGGVPGCSGVFRECSGFYRHPSKWQEIRLGAFTILVNLCLLMQGTSKPLPSNVRNEIVNLFNAGLGLSDIARNMRVPKGAVRKIV